MSRPEWEPLTTAEAVVDAFEKERYIEIRFPWGDWHQARVAEIAERMIDAGARYRARIEGGAE